MLEDEVIIGMDIEAFLWDEGFEVMLATDCDVAIQWLTAEKPDVAILDVQLKNGVCTPLAKKLVKKAIPFIVHTGADIEMRDPVFGNLWKIAVISQDVMERQCERYLHARGSSS